MFVLQRGQYNLAKLEYSYGRRAQSTVRSLQWKDTALIDTDNLEVAIAEARSAIADWLQQGYSADRWRLEGRGENVMQQVEIELIKP